MRAQKSYKDTALQPSPTDRNDCDFKRAANGKRISFSHAQQVQVRWHQDLPPEFYDDIYQAVHIWNQAIGRELLVVNAQSFQADIFSFLAAAVKGLTTQSTKPYLEATQNTKPYLEATQNIEATTQNSILIFKVDEGLGELGLNQFLAHTRHLHRQHQISRAFIYFNFKEFLFWPARYAKPTGVATDSHEPDTGEHNNKQLTDSSFFKKLRLKKGHIEKAQRDRFKSRASFLAVLLHEMGHALGLQHNRRHKKSIMYENRRGGFNAKAWLKPIKLTRSENKRSATTKPKKVEVGLKQVESKNKKTETVSHHMRDGFQNSSIMQPTLRLSAYDVHNVLCEYGDNTGT